MYRNSCIDMCKMLAVGIRHLIRHSQRSQVNNSLSTRFGRLLCLDNHMMNTMDCNNLEIFAPYQGSRKLNGVDSIERLVTFRKCLTVDGLCKLRRGRWISTRSLQHLACYVFPVVLTEGTKRVGMVKDCFKQSKGC